MWAVRMGQNLAGSRVGSSKPTRKICLEVSSRLETLLDSAQHHSACTYCTQHVQLWAPNPALMLTPVLAAHHTQGSSHPTVCGQDVLHVCCNEMQQSLDMQGGMRLTETVELGVLVP